VVVGSGESDNSKSEQAKQYMDLEHCMHWLHLEPTLYTVYTDCTWSPLTTTLAWAEGARRPGRRTYSWCSG
jgi:hypothetical protein